MAESTYTGYVLVFGGSGALGSGCVTHFKSRNWFVASVEVWKHIPSEEETAHASSVYLLSEGKNLVDQEVNREADVNILVQTDRPLKEQEADILTCLENLFQAVKLDAIICVAGGYITCNLNENFIKNCEKMWRQNVWPSMLSAIIATKLLKPHGMLCLTGAKAALEGTPSAIGYGFCKAAVHQLVKTLACPGSGLPENTFCVALLPVTLDTVMNRQMMPTADISGWTPTKYITDLLLKWADGKERPTNGNLVQFVTQNFNTDITFL